MASSVVEQVLRKDLCAGCGACAHIAPDRITMAVSDAGFLRPVMSGRTSRSEEEAIRAACPGSRMVQDAGGREDHVLWGPLVAVRSGFATDPHVRWRGSSGGVLSALLIHLLEEGEVARVVQTSASVSLPFANRTVVSLSADAVTDAAGSRYAPSAPLSEIEAVLAAEGRSAFVGKPCDVAALRALARRDPRIDEKIPYMFSFFCAGVPSHEGARQILAAMNMPEEGLASFQYRGQGWPGKTVATTTDGRRAEMSYEDSWGQILSKHLQFRCKVCPDGTGGFADVVCADAWHCDERGYPLFEEEDGISLIVSRTERGERLVRRCLESGRVNATPTPAETIAAMQPSQARRKTVVLARLAAVAVIRRGAPRFAGFNLLAAARRAGVSENVRGFLGTCARLLATARRRSRRGGPGGDGTVAGEASLPTPRRLAA